MEIKPLRNYKNPEYPEKDIVLRNPNILQSMPQRWKGNTKIGIALSSAILMILTSGCGKSTGGPDDPQVSINTGEPGGRQGPASSGESREGASAVTPIFRHGEGRGSYGCVSVAPPAFLSEAEAFEVISEEAKREGIIFEKDGLEFSKMKIPVTSLNYVPEEERPKNPGYKTGTLEMDGYDADKKIAFEFVSKDDIVGWQGENPGVMSSVESYEALDTAERLKESLDGKTNGNTAVLFYDPMGFEKEVNDKYNLLFAKINENKELTEDERNEKWTQINQQYEDELKEMKTAQLREQVKDFLDWMKAQGVI